MLPKAYNNASSTTFETIRRNIDTVSKTLPLNPYIVIPIEKELFNKDTQIKNKIAEYLLNRFILETKLSILDEVSNEIKIDVNIDKKDTILNVIMSSFFRKS